ncbi:WD40 repeat domain-containing protein [Nonomuraea guangzhouensis]|uniref:WD40 repeat domain-containing protein n=1 Tax=Nonomuraea guangzhouensis TaxID=1291555 RepID=A0ABW4GPJ1_9ACTN|nr:WD40 repeat domain-containing protein [Nonomuraea guangzhouensis]
MTDAPHRLLCRLDEYFHVSVVACPNDLSVVLAGAGATSNNDLGEVLLLRPDPDAEEPNQIAVLAEQSTAVDAVFSPDGARVTVGYTDIGGGSDGPGTYGLDGVLRHSFAIGEEFEADGDWEGDIAFDRLAQSGDGQLLAGGSLVVNAVTVADSATGRILLTMPDATGPAALDHTGGRLAYARPDGRVSVREMISGAALSTWDTGLPAVHALAFSPDGAGLVAAGGDRPTACLFTADGDRTDVMVADPALTIDATLPWTAISTRACWTSRGPAVFTADDYLAVLFDATNGRVLWTGSDQTVASFTPNGRIFVASSSDGISAWFLDALA